MDEPPDFKQARRIKATLADPTKLDRLPPHSIEAEQGVLGCILLSPEDCLPLCVEKFKNSEVFYDLRHRTIYDALLGMLADSAPIDLITVQQELRDMLQLEGVGGLGYLASLPDTVPAAANLDYYVQILLEKHTLRKAIALATDVVTKAYEHQGEVVELIAELEHDILEIARGATQEPTLRKANQIVPLSINWAENALQNQGQLSGMPTGLVDLDTLTNGLSNGEMIVIAARPSTGKTSLVMNIADYVAVNLQFPVAVFSLEMSRLSLMNRAICSRARVPMNIVKRGQMQDVHYERFTSACAQLNNSPLYIDDASGTSILQFQAKARRYHQQYGVRLIIADYLQLFTAKAESRQHEITLISQGVKSIAKELNVPVIVAAQLNRELEKDKKKRKPRMSDIRESGSCEQEADLIGLLYEPEVPEDSDTPPEQNTDVTRINMIVAKHRNGEAGMEIPLAFIKSYTRFESASNANYE